MTAIGKLLVFSCLFAGLGMLTWSASIYIHRPGWFNEPTEAVDKGNNPVVFKQMKTEIDSLGRSAAAASESWGHNLKLLQTREQVRAERKAGYAERIQWAIKGHPTDRANPKDPKSPGIGFYEPVIGEHNLYDLSKDDRGLPRGKHVLGKDGRPLPGLDGLLASITGDADAIVDLSKQILDQREKLIEIDAQVIAMENRLLRMNTIRDSVLAELYFLSTFEVDVLESRATVFRREQQLRNRLRSFGLMDP